MSLILRIIDGINKWVGSAISWLGVVLIIVVMYDVVMRYVFKMPTIWGNETSIYIFAAIWVLGGGYTLFARGFVSMDVVLSRVSRRTQAIINSCTFILALTFVSVLVWQSILSFKLSIFLKETSSSAWDPPFYPIRFILVLGAFLVLIQLISNFIKDLYIAAGKGNINEP